MVSFIEEDEEFTKEIIGLFIINLIDFRNSLAEAVKQDDMSIYFKAHHRITTTLGYVNDGRLDDFIQKIFVILNEHGIKGIDTKTQNAFCRCCTSAIRSLESDLEKLKRPNDQAAPKELNQ